jgi:hypothetical protein
MGLRGIKRYNSLQLFPEDRTAEVEDERMQGRDPELIRKRNVRLVHRLYWYKREYPLHKYDVVMDWLVEEFEISTTTIYKVLAEVEYDRLLNLLARNKPTNEELKTLYVWMDWDLKRG